MKKRLTLFAALLFVFTLTFCNTEENTPKVKASTVVDDLGNNFSFTAAPERVITLAPNLTEMMYALGCGEHLVGNTLYCNYPPAADSVAKVGDMLTIDFEKIVTLKPDLVFITVEGNTKQIYDRLNQLGVKAFVSNPRSYKGIKKTFTDMSIIMQCPDTAKAIISKWEQDVAAVVAKGDLIKLPKAMFMVQVSPVMLAGKNTFVNEYLELCGLKNIADDAVNNYPLFNREEILERNPEYIIHSNSNYTLKELLNVYPEWESIKAVKEGNIIVIDPDLFFRPGPRFTEALTVLSNHLRR